MSSRMSVLRLPWNARWGTSLSASLSLDSLTPPAKMPGPSRFHRSVMTMARAFNFNAGPAVLPVEVLEEVRAQLLDYKGSGMSILEASHRGKEYEAIHNEAADNLRKLLSLPEDRAVLFLGGGATTQFAMVPLNLLGDGQTAD